MHKFINDNFTNIDETPMQGKFGKPKTKKSDSINLMNYKNENIEEFYKSIPELENYVRDCKDPSLGPRHIEKAYPFCNDVIIKCLFLYLSIKIDTFYYKK
jgi:hypothetical protein